MEVHHHPHATKGFKGYFLEFLMIFLAVTMGFFAEGLRERLVNNEKERNYMESMIQDLKRDTAEANHIIRFQNVIVKRMDSALQIPVVKLTDINIQDTFFHHFVFFYSWIAAFSRYDNTITQLKNAGGFNVIHKKPIVDSINELGLFYDGVLKYNRDIYLARWQRLDEFAMQLMILPAAPVEINDTIYRVFPHHVEVFTRYDRPMLQQLYSFIRFEKSDIEINIADEAQYRDEAARLITFIKKEYRLKTE
jgi:hypothetical protein